MDRITERAVSDVLADLVSNGGGTYDNRTLLPFRPTSGYAVAIGGITLDAADTGVAELAWACKSVAGEFMTPFVGTWLDKGVVYIDGVRYFSAERLEAALALGRESSQLAIYDFAAQSSITLGQES